MRLHRLASILTWLMRRTRAEQQLDEELRTFVEMAAADRMRDGASPAEARRLAVLELGGVEPVKERVRTGRHGALLDEVGRDLRYAVRLLLAHRSVTAVVVLTLALGIGANTAIFSIIDSLLLRSLPVKEPDRLAVLVSEGPSPQASWTYPIWEQAARHADQFDGVFATSTFDSQFNLAQGGETQFVNGLFVSASAFPILGVHAVLGRTFAPDDDVRGGGASGPAAVISHAFWQRHFGGARDVIGRTLMLERVPFTIIGVTPPGFFGLNVGRSFDVAIPFGVEPLVRGARNSRLDQRTSWWLSIMVRLKPGQTVEHGAAVWRTLQPQIREATLPTGEAGANTDDYLEHAFTLIEASSGRSGLRNQYRRPLTVIMTVVALVLLIACANIANLLLARATARSHEWSVRLALGASRGRLARQLLIESLVLSAIGAAAGLAVAHWGSRLLVAQLDSDAVSLDLPLDWRVLAFTAGISMLAALVCGVAPAMRAARGAPIDAMKDRGRSAAGGRLTVANGLVVGQVVLSVVLVVGAGLFLRTFGALTQVPLGFERERLLLVGIDARRSTIAPAARAGVYDRVLQRVRLVPGVESAGMSLIAPLSGALWSRRVDVSGSAIANVERTTGPEGFGFTDSTLPANEPLAAFNATTPGWIASYRTRLRAGRDFTEDDGRASAPVALVNQAFVHKFLRGASPIGHTIRAADVASQPPREIVGLVDDTVYRNLREAALPTVYVPLGQYDRGGADAPALLTLTVRATSQSPALLTKAVAGAVGEINPTLALTVRPLGDQVDEAVMQERLLALLSASFGALALLMAAVGLYGVTTYSVNLRRSEIGIRMALGATRAAVIRLVLHRVTILVGVGLGVGLALAAWASQFVSPLLYGLEPGDPLTLIGSAAALAAIGAIAGWLPAHRASRLDPTTVLGNS